MKKLTVFLMSIILLSACGGNNTTKTSANTSANKTAVAQTPVTKIVPTQDPVKAAIFMSNFDEFSKLVADIKPEQLDGYLSYAAGICNPYRRAQRGDNGKAVCQKENNAKIIQVLANLGAKSSSVRFFIDEGYTLYQAKTIVSDLKEWNPMAVPYVVAKIDKCLVALTQMQEADDKKANYYVYADVWRNNNCSTKNYQITYGMSTAEEKALYFLIGANKEAVQKEFGTNPTIYEHPSQYREILTYKQAKERQAGITFSVEEYHYIFTIDRGVVTGIKRIHVSSTDTKGQKEVIDQEKLKEQQKQIQERYTGKPVGKRERAMRGMLK